MGHIAGYEWDVGHFKGAQRPDVDCFKSTEFGLTENEVTLFKLFRSAFVYKIFSTKRKLTNLTWEVYGNALDSSCFCSAVMNSAEEK